LEYVESRITLLAPNISAIVGTTTATKILGIAGGLNGLTRIPHSNIYVRSASTSIGRVNTPEFAHAAAFMQLLGAVKRANTGFSTAAHSVDRLHTGFIYQCPLVQRTRPEDRMKAQRKVGAKVALAARVDIAKSSPHGAFGEEMKGKLEAERWSGWRDLRRSRSSRLCRGLMRRRRPGEVASGASLTLFLFSPLPVT
jgi:U4/U6 small nuclear ribonucleoprotein PRP31